MSQSERTGLSSVVAGFFAELKRRRVLHIGGAYIAGAWLGAEVLTFLLEQFQAPAWTLRFIAIVFVVGFPVTMILAWIVQVQADGTWAIDSSRGDHRTVAVAIALAMLATAGLSWLIVPDPQPEATYELLPNSLAVLPFGEEEGPYRSLMAGLEQSQTLMLVWLEPIDVPDDLVAFGRNLGVASLAYGQRAGDDAGNSFELRLLDIAQEDVSWSHSFDSDTGGMIETSHVMAKGLLKAMALPVLSSEGLMGTEDVRAYERLLNGRRNSELLTVSSLRTAIDEFQAAIDLDPGYARAYTDMAEAIYELLTLADAAEDERNRLKSRARTAVDAAQKLDRTSADAMSLLGYGTRNRQLRIQAFERALELDPDHYMSYYRYALQMKDDGNFDEAENLMRRALLYQPMSERFELELAEIIRLRSPD